MKSYIFSFLSNTSCQSLYSILHIDNCFVPPLNKTTLILQWLRMNTGHDLSIDCLMEHEATTSIHYGSGLLEALAAKAILNLEVDLNLTNQ